MKDSPPPPLAKPLTSSLRSTRRHRPRAVPADIVPKGEAAFAQHPRGAVVSAA